ncbi:MAG: TraR/DksA family transcriptional regulator [Candidatus Omnitrophota bacterium]
MKIKNEKCRDPETTLKRAVKSGKKKLNKKEVVIFKKLILKRKEQILDELKHITEDTLKKSQKEACGDISGYTYHMADVATDTYDREFSLGIAAHERQVLFELDDALKKMEEGTFGICEDCKCVIAKIRLKAVPQARLCVKCQEKKEKNNLP